MFVVIISFQIRQGMEDSFKATWKSLTELIHLYAGSLGSRLHKAGDCEYIAYAQWPDKKSWMDSSSLPEISELRIQLRACCLVVETKYELEMVEDLLKKEVAQKYT